MPTIPTITVANNGDGTATVTVAGGDAGVTNEVQTLKVDSIWPGNSWVAWTPTRVGNGTVDVSVGAGAYFFTVSVDGAVMAAPVFAVISVTSDSLQKQIGEAVVTRLRLMSLSGVTSSKIEYHAKFDLKQVSDVQDLRIFVGPMDEALAQYDDAGSTHNRFGYPFLIAVTEPTDRDESTANASFLRNQRIRNAFVDGPLVLASGTVEIAEFIPLPDYVRAWWKMNSAVVFTALRFRSSEARGL